MIRTSLALGVVLAGCNGNLTLAEGPTQAPATVTKVAAPDEDSRTSLRLVKEGNEFMIGNEIEEMYRVFGNPKTSTEFSDLPPGFDPPYSAKGWETAREGVGAILYHDRVVAVMRQLTRATDQQLTEIVDAIRKGNPSVQPKVVQGTRVVYYFWEQGSQRIMVTGLNTRTDAWHITEALGDDTVMDALRANPKNAESDKTTVDSKFATPKT